MRNLRLKNIPMNPKAMPSIMEPKEDNGQTGASHAASPAAANQDYARKPLLVFWETTSACNLSCRHCRACAAPEPKDGELTESEGLRLLEQIALFGKPSPIVVLTGGDPLMRQDLESLLHHGHELGLRLAVSPAVTPLLDNSKLQMIARYASAISLSLDGRKEFHDWLRGVPGTWRRTLEIAKKAADLGIKTQFNTLIAKDNLEDLPAILKLALKLGVSAWELFFLIGTGRGKDLKEASPRKLGSVCHFLKSISGLQIRAVEAPFFRLPQEVRLPDEPRLTAKLIKKSSRLAGAHIFSGGRRSRPHHTGDGKGIIFINSRGDVTPSGFLPIPLGSVKEKPLTEIYRDEATFRALRDPMTLKGKCGQCPYSAICGGSRARAAAHSGDPFSEDPACPVII